MVNKKTTGKQVAKIASKEMKNPKRKDKSVPASDLSQVVPGRETSSKVATKAAKGLTKKTTPKKEKVLDASAVSQAHGKKSKALKKKTK